MKHIIYSKRIKYIRWNGTRYDPDQFAIDCTGVIYGVRTKFLNALVKFGNCESMKVIYKERKK